MAKVGLPAALDPSATPRLYKKGKGGGGGGGGGLIFITIHIPFRPSFALSPPVPCREPFHCQCPSPAVPLPCSPPPPEPTDLSPTARPCAPSPDPTVLPPPQQPTARAAAVVAAHCRCCRALVHPVRAQPTAPPSRGLHYTEPCFAPAVRLDRRHGLYSWWFSL